MAKSKVKALTSTEVVELRKLLSVTTNIRKGMTLKGEPTTETGPLKDPRVDEMYERHQNTKRAEWAHRKAKNFVDVELDRKYAGLNKQGLRLKDRQFTGIQHLLGEWLRENVYYPKPWE